MVAVRTLAPHRWGMAFGIAALGGFLVGVPKSLAWLAAVAVSEAVIWVACSGFVRDPGRVTAQRRGVGVAALFLNHLVWFAFILVVWFDPRPTVKMVALVFWFGALLYNQSRSFQSPGAVLLYGVLMAALAAVFVATLGTVGLIERVGLTVAFLLAAQNSATASIMDFRAAKTLARTAEALRAETRAADSANRAKSAFLAMMSHELRTPMNGVLGLAHALRGTPLTARQTDLVETQLRSGDALMTILNDILDFSKIEAGRLELDYASTDPRVLVDEVVRLWRPAAAARGVSLAVQVADDVPVAVRADGARLRQILVNLTSNALKFTERGSVTLAVEAATLEGAPALRIHVTDTGTGVPEELRPRLFTAFAQAEAAMSKRAAGTGLGLAIARRLAELMGGSLDLAWSSPRGSCFTLAFRAEPAEAVAPVEADDTRFAAGVRVLVAEDNAVNRKVVAALLEPSGCALTMVDDGRQAVDALRRATFDLVLMDINMPVMDGLEALAAIRSGAAGAPDLPVVALTAHAMLEERQHLLDRGFDEVVAKPIRPAELLSVLAGVGVRPATAEAA